MYSSLVTGAETGDRSQQSTLNPMIPHSRGALLRSVVPQPGRQCAAAGVRPDMCQELHVSSTHKHYLHLRARAHPRALVVVQCNAKPPPTQQQLSRGCIRARNVSVPELEASSVRHTTTPPAAYTTPQRTAPPPPPVQLNRQMLRSMNVP